MNGAELLEKVLVEDTSKPHTLIVIGKGGVGKTTLSILASLVYSRYGKTIVASLDPAKHMLEYLGLKKALKESKVSDRLYAIQYDINPLAKKVANEYALLLRQVMPGLTILNLDDIVKSIRYAPGFEEEIFLRILEELYMKDYDYVVIDTPPTGITHRLLTLPNLYMFWVKQLYELRLKIVSLRYAIARAMGRKEKPRDPVLDKLEDLGERYDNLWNSIKNPKRTSIMIVTTPEPLPVYEAKTTINLIKSHEFKCRALVVNRVLDREKARITGLYETEVESIREALRIKGDCKTLTVLQHEETPKTLDEARKLLNLIRPTEEVLAELVGVSPSR